MWVECEDRDRDHTWVNRVCWSVGQLSACILKQITACKTGAWAEASETCYDHTQEGVGLLFFSPVSLCSVPLPRTFWNVPWWSTYLRYGSYSRPLQYDVEWRSTFHELLGLSIWLHTLWTIYYKLYSIKYKYHVVAILYLSLVFIYSLTIPRFLSSSVQLELCALLWTTVHCATDPLFHSITALLTPSNQEQSSSWQDRLAKFEAWAVGHFRPPPRLSPGPSFDGWLRPASGSWAGPGNHYWSISALGSGRVVFFLFIFKVHDQSLAITLVNQLHKTWPTAYLPPHPSAGKWGPVVPWIDQHQRQWSNKRCQPLGGSSLDSSLTGFAIVLQFYACL